MFESRHKKPISQKQFHLRMLKCLFIVIFFTLISLVFGILGFEYFEGYSILDALLNASMLLGGMGQINPIVTNGGKVFASIYAIYGGLFVLASIGLLMAPLLHRIMHKFHAE